MCLCFVSSEWAMFFIEQRLACGSYLLPLSVFEGGSESLIVKSV